MSQPAVEEDDAIFTQLITKVSHSTAAVDDDSNAKNYSRESINFLNKKFGSLSSFYNAKTEAKKDTSVAVDGFSRIKKLRSALNALDKGGWERSYHQRCFHEQFLCAVCRVLFKTDPPGHFERSYPRLLETNNWETIRQEILISTPRRFGKTISVCLFVSALVYACPNLEVSIYSTCKRISCKLLRNCTRFLQIIADVLKEPMMTYLKATSDEVELQGPESKRDTRRLNSYPSKVTRTLSFCLYIACCVRDQAPCIRAVHALGCIFVSGLAILVRYFRVSVSSFRTNKHAICQCVHIVALQRRRTCAGPPCEKNTCFD